MIIVRPEDTIHKAQLLRLLTRIVDDPVLTSFLRFKGGTCAAMMGILDRFSVDLDFDVAPQADEQRLREHFHAIFSDMELTIKNESKRALEFFVRYQSMPLQRNTIKIDALNIRYKATTYAPFFLPEINRTVICQTTDTIVANKLVAPLDRFEKNKTVAGRDIYDIHHFLLHGLPYNKALIAERTHHTCKTFFQNLSAFVERHVTDTVINEDLNTLLPPSSFQKLRKVLKTETLLFLAQELQRLSHEA